jgi:regulator of protease activity HflC (stomatin/prohibitin superfamily)
VETHDHNPPPQPGGLTGLPAAAPDLAQASLVSALRSSFAVLRLVMYVLVILYAVSGVFRIEPGDQGVVVWLGKLVLNRDKSSEYYDKPVFGQGWIWAWPDPFSERICISGKTQEEESDTFLFKRSAQDIKDRADISTLKRGGPLKPGQDGAMLTGDKNLSHGLWKAEYRITDAAKFVTQVGERPQDFDPMLRRLLDSSVLREVSHRKVEEVTRTKRDIVADAVRSRLQRQLDDLDVGVTIIKVTANTIVPPQVAEAFDKVTQAENEKRALEEAARQTATEVLNKTAGPQYVELLERIRAYGAAELAGADQQRREELRKAIDDTLELSQGDVAVRLRDAQAKANTEREQLKGKYDEFVQRLEQYRAYPRQTLISLWTGMRKEVLGSDQNEVFWVPDTDRIDIVVNRDPNRAREAEIRRLKQQVLESR